MKLLLTADIHLGRGSTGLPPSMSGRELALSCREAWGRIVDLSVREEVDAVLIAGDLVEESRAYYESLGPLVDGFQRLRDASIQLFAVGGNHDARAFERIANDCRGMDGVHFLGRGGKWERVPLTIDGQARLQIEGWSFPDHRFPSDPGNVYDLDRSSGLPVLGILHADLGSAASPYAPTTAAALRNLPADFWLLGHIHKPNRDERPGEATILYPGSPQAMDFGEAGWHGVWLLDLEDGELLLTKRQTSTVRFENSISVEVSADDAQETVEVALRIAADEHLAALDSSERGALQCIVHRSQLRGECADGTLVNALENTLPDFLPPERDGLIACFDGRIDDQTVLPLDLSQLATRGGAIGRLARSIMDLESDAWKGSTWFESIYEGVCKEYEGCRIEGDEEIRDNGEPLFGPPRQDELRNSLAQQARQLMLATRGEAS